MRVCRAEIGARTDHVAWVRRDVHPAEHRSHACDQLLRAERLRHVVVGAGLQPGHLVAFVDPRRQHDDGNVGMLAQRARDVEAMHVGQTEVEDDQVRPAVYARS